VFEVFRRRLHVSEAMRGSRSWSRTRNAVTGVVAIVAIVFSLAAPRAVASPLPDVATLLEDYTRATTDPGASEVTQYESVGTLLGGGLTGEFHSWAKGDNERTDENLGPRSETTLRIGSRIWDSDANGDVRELTGVLARRERTQDFIDSGNFAKAPERSVFRGIERIGGRQTYALDVTAENGETETLYLDAETALPDRVAYDDDDGRTTVDLSDWRDVGGHRYPFKSIVSDGDRAFDTVQTTTSISLSGAIPPKVFAPLVRYDSDRPERRSPVRPRHDRWEALYVFARYGRARYLDRQTRRARFGLDADRCARSERSHAYRRSTTRQTR
jgi:hypothetical protein